jgi:hypothetical protein
MFSINFQAPMDPHSGDLEHGFCNGARIQSVFGSFTTWNCKRGFEIIHGKNLRIENQTHMDHTHTGFDIQGSEGPYGLDGPGIYNSVLVARSRVYEETGNTLHMLIGLLAPQSGYTLDKLEFYNFDTYPGFAFQQAAAYGYPSYAIRSSRLKFVNSSRIVGTMYGKDDEHCMLIYDVDGYLTGTANSQLITASETHPKDKCTSAPEGLVVPKTGEVVMLDKGKFGHPAMVCDGDVRFHRFHIGPKWWGNVLAPDSIEFVNLTLRNEHGSSTRQYGIVLKNWFGYMPEGTVNYLSFDSVEHVTEIAYKIRFDNILEDGESFLLVGHKFFQYPNAVSLLDEETPRNMSTGLMSLPAYETSY